MLRVLVAAKTEQSCENISRLLCGEECEISVCCDGASVRALDVSTFDIVIVSTPLSDEFGLDLVAELKDRTNAGLIVLAKSDIADEVQNKLKFAGAFVIGRPFPKSALIQAMRFSTVARDKYRELEKEKENLSRQLTEVKTISRAKNLLMQYLALTEEQAHRHIQKQAMDLRKSQLEVAEDVLKTYLS